MGRNRQARSAEDSGPLGLAYLVSPLGRVAALRKWKPERNPFPCGVDVQGNGFCRA